MTSYYNIIYGSNLPALKINIDYPQEKIFNEIKNIPKKFFVDQIGNKYWQGTALRGISYDRPRPFFEYGYKNEEEVPYVWTDVANICPDTVSFLNNFFCTKFYRIKISNLKPGGKIHPHVDSNKNGLGVSDKTTSGDTKFLMFSVYWPENVIFNIDRYSLPIKTGEAWLLNYSLIHEIANYSNQNRYMLTITGDLDHSINFKNSVKNSYFENSKLELLRKKEIKNTINY
ncbi:aspartyl/asparaginyl beta-hydroxylase domain-containing protein [Candidatus Pelagibacter sp.]|uniref:aspartyl/asparaginyl beta-hydroxylase domain-containing protein n=1 Tax=Candidatus Pelagibacter sp. TaxID=2024849 RepID=UPI003F8375F6|tara:strand:+ start:114 stop:800 length:687 start_codon:yes stop_codon:yes gene_type:complete